MVQTLLEGSSRGVATLESGSRGPASQDESSGLSLIDGIPESMVRHHDAMSPDA